MGLHNISPFRSIHAANDAFKWSLILWAALILDSRGGIGHGHLCWIFTVASVDAKCFAAGNACDHSARTEMRQQVALYHTSFDPLYDDARKDPFQDRACVTLRT